MQDYELQYEKYVARQEARLQLNEMREQAQEEDNERRYAAMEYREKYDQDNGQWLIVNG
jgi:hypothetical protein